MVDLEKLFKNVILIDVGLSILTLIVGMVEPSDYGSSGGISAVLGVLALIYLVLYFINLYLLYTFRPLGRSAYVPILVLGGVLGLLAGPYVLGALAYTLTWIGGMTAGAIIVLIHFTELKERFF